MVKESRSTDFWAYIHKQQLSGCELAEVVNTRIEMHQSVMSKTCLLCSSRIWFAFEYINSKTIWTHSLGFHSPNLKHNVWNPIGRQCFDFVRPKSWSVRPNWRICSNFVHPESLSLRLRTQGCALDTSLHHHNHCCHHHHHDIIIIMTSYSLTLLCLLKS